MQTKKLAAGDSSFVVDLNWTMFGVPDVRPLCGRTSVSGSVPSPYPLLLLPAPQFLPLDPYSYRSATIGHPQATP